ncbi:MAG: hypothetical protein NTZ61_06580 [Proteobacteria bacterium]|nr:hypothetical protein [Pseudomonadota bacterium]
MTGSRNMPMCPVAGSSPSPVYEAVAGCVTYWTAIESGLAPGGAVIDTICPAPRVPNSGQRMP